MFRILVGISLFFSSAGAALTANKVSMELRSNGRFRVYIHYTSIEQKELREAYVDFSKKSEAEEVFFKLVRGADFTLGSGPKVEFPNPTNAPRPW